MVAIGLAGCGGGGEMVARIGSGDYDSEASASFAANFLPADSGGCTNSIADLVMERLHPQARRRSSEG